MKYRKKPVVIEAFQLRPNNATEIAEWCGGTVVTPHFGPDDIVISTLEGDMLASSLDFIIKGVAGEFYPCKPDIFAETYEAVEGETL